VLLNLTGTYADGLRQRRDPNCIDFDPFLAVVCGLITQMKRWGQVKGDID
jgi:nitrate/nitrite transport system substrate-binding protein